MDLSKQRLSIEQAKNVDMVTYLSTLGLEPSKIRSNDYWYLSPFRNEKTPSFKINQKLNRWYDHGIGKGGNLVDFAIQYHSCSISEVLQDISGHLSFQKPVLSTPFIIHERENHIKVIEDFLVTSSARLNYLHQRYIPVYIADRYCREVRYKLGEKIYYGIGFKNDSGGFEIRNPYFKASSSPKDITTFDNNAEEVIVFEGFMDFLSFKAVHKNEPEGRFDFAVLNSLSFFETARSFMEKHTAIRLYLDRDNAGQNFSRHALSLSNKYRDESSLYKNYKDFNDWVMNLGKAQKKAHQQSSNKITAARDDMLDAV